MKGGGVGLLGMTFIVFLVLKLVGKIAWSWWWVTAPLWGPSSLFVAVAAICLVVWLAWGAGIGVAALVKKARRR